MSNIPGKKVSESRLTVLHRPLPDESNTVGKVYGGHILRHMDNVGAMCAFRHARGQLVTASVERMDFREPVTPGEIMMFHASVNMVGNTSMEVGIRTEAEDAFTGEVRHVGTCYMTFVGVDDEGRPRRLPPVIPEDDTDIRRMGDAARRAALHRLERRGTGCNARCVPVQVLPGTFALCLLPADAPLPAMPAEAFVSMTRGPEGLFLVLNEDAGALKLGAGAKVESGYACLRLSASPDMSAGAVTAGFSTMLAAAGVPLLTLSTFDAQYLLLPKDREERALDVLRSVGHPVL